MPADGTRPDQRSASALRGVTLEQFAGITVALAEGFPLAEVLANERIVPAAWPRVELAWKERLAADGPEGALFAEFCAKRSEAEDWLGREVTPLDSDLAAWLSFLHAWSGHPAPFDLLQGAGLRMSDVSRLRRRWERRMAEEPDLQKQAAEIVEKGAGSLPPIHVGAVELRPFPWSRGGVRSPEPAADAAELAGGDADELPLDRYAALTAELTASSSNEAHVLAKYGLSRQAFSRLNAAWKQRLGADRGLERDYRRLLEHQRARLRSSAEHDGRAPAAPTSAAPAALDALAPALARPPVHRAPSDLAGTSLLLEIRCGPALPFVEGTPAAEIAKGSPTRAAAPRARPDLGGTSLTVEVPRGPALPFPGATAPPAAAGPSKLAETSLTVDVPKGPALPFVEGVAPAEIAKGTGDPAPKRPHEELGGTSPSVELPRGPALPFVKDAALPAENLAEQAPSKLAGTSLAVDVPRGPAVSVR